MRREELEELIRPVLQEAGLELVQCTVARGGRLQNIRITLDHPAGLSVDTCAKVSRRIATLLDANPLLRAAYNLEVSSPGMKRPIWSAEHFRRFSGERVRVNLRETSAEPHFLIGLIGAEEGGAFWIEPEPEHGAGREQGRPGRDRSPKVKAHKPSANGAAETGAHRNEQAASASARRLVRLDEIAQAELDLDPWKPREKKKAGDSGATEDRASGNDQDRPRHAAG